jgi:hypothetical protein
MLVFPALPAVLGRLLPVPRAEATEEGVEPAADESELLLRVRAASPSGSVKRREEVSRPSTEPLAHSSSTRQRWVPSVEKARRRQMLRWATRRCEQPRR